jgi:hypothetical protein
MPDRGPDLDAAKRWALFAGETLAHAAERASRALRSHVMDVFLVWHVRHARNADGSPTEHRDTEGQLALDEEFDDLKITGAYADEQAAEAAIARARLRPGFRDEPDCFMIDGFTIGEDLWVEGFVSEPIEAD